MRFFLGAIESFASLVGCIFGLIWYGILFFVAIALIRWGLGIYQRLRVALH
ncbi:hypothetical protein [Ligilactobacillus murinus]|uniref:hypothetical protein n=1 Tax=Ligilactobacillus murinus TaxID=1622 RepID=UPI0013A68DC8|nr:hypothetical protein [Ligilactobacillus murinus]MCR1890479.1 hypothetical protein [Ligilactobacillus murinus]